MEKSFEQYAIQEHHPRFLGNGTDLFLLILKNAVLTIITLGIYFAWAKVNLLKFIYHNVELDGHRFRFHATGKEVFIGFLKGLLVLLGLVVVVGIVFSLITLIGKLTGIAVELLMPFVLIGFYILMALLMGYIDYSAAKFRMYRTSYNEIRFRLAGDPKAFAKGFCKYFFASLFSLGLLSGFLIHFSVKYKFSRLYFGNATFSYTGNRSELTQLFIKGMLLSIITVGVYGFWFSAQLHKYVIDHIKINGMDIKTNVSGAEYFYLSITNILLIIFTLGFGTAWAEIRYMKFFVENVSIQGDLDIKGITKADTDETDGMGEGLSDGIDTGIGFGI